MNTYELRARIADSIISAAYWIEPYFFKFLVYIRLGRKEYRKLMEEMKQYENIKSQ